MAPITIPTKFTITSWDQNKVKPENELPFNPNVAISDRDYTGELEGKVTGAYTMLKYSNSDNKEDGCFHGVQIFTGTLQGKKGSFASLVDGKYVGGEVKATLTIITESSTDELKGIKGHGTFHIPDVPANVAKHKVDPNFRDVVDGDLTFEL